LVSVGQGRGVRPIIIIGTGGMGRDLHALLRDLEVVTPGLEVIGFLDDDARRLGELVHGLPVLGGTSWVSGNPSVDVAVGIGSPAGKRRVVQRLRELGARFPSLVHPSAVVGGDVEIGEGTIVSAGCVLTTDIRVGAFVTINTLCSLAHDDVVGAYASLAPGVHLAGNVHVGEGADIGTGAVTVQGVEIGEWSIVGAGTVVVCDVPANVTAVGSPARVVKQWAAGWHA